MLSYGTLEWWPHMELVVLEFRRYRDSWKSLPQQPDRHSLTCHLLLCILWVKQCQPAIVCLKEDKGNIRAVLGGLETRKNVSSWLKSFVWHDSTRLWLVVLTQLQWLELESRLNWPADKEIYCIKPIVYQVISMWHKTLQMVKITLLFYTNILTILR